jgi:hypothetical protein
MNLSEHAKRLRAIKGNYILNKYAHLNPADCVFTPDIVAQHIVELYKPTGVILEPCRGEGAFTKFLPPETLWCEIADGVNFYDFNQHVDWIITNPPYSDFDRFFDHCLELADNIVFLVPVAKIFKSMGTLRKIRKYGWIKHVWLVGASKCGFPFGFPCGAYHFARGYRGETSWSVDGELSI